MKIRTAATAVALAIGAVACGSGDDAGEAADDRVELELWVQWTGDAVDELERIIDGYEADHPGVEVTVVPGAGDPAKLLAAISAGDAPDLAASFKVEDLPRYCSSGAWEDLTPRLEADDLDLEMFPPVARASTAFDGRQCALPYLADAFGLYYNRELLAAAGYSQPPRTMSELSEMAKALTQRNADGSIDVAGFVPLVNWYQSYLLRYPPLFDAAYFDGDGSAALADDPDWASYFQWQRELVDWYGAEDLARFAAGAGDEWSAAHAFQTGKVAMLYDGEWRTQAIAKEAPDLDYATAPMPVSDDHPELYGAGHVTVGFLLMPEGGDHPDEAWDLLRYLTTDTDALVRWANHLQNLPTTIDAIGSPDLDFPSEMQAFLDIYAHPRSAIAALREEGSLYFEPIELFAERWQSGSIPSDQLDQELRRVDDEIDTLMTQGR